MRCNLATVIWMHFPPDTMFWVAESLLLVLITSTHTSANLRAMPKC